MPINEIGVRPSQRVRNRQRPRRRAPRPAPRPVTYIAHHNAQFGSTAPPVRRRPRRAPRPVTYVAHHNRDFGSTAPPPRRHQITHPVATSRGNAAMALRQRSRLNDRPYSPAVARGLALASQKAFAPKPRGGLHTPFGTVSIPSALAGPLGAVVKYAPTPAAFWHLAATVGPQAKFVRKEMHNAAQDAIDIPTGIVPGTYGLGKALYKAVAHGNSSDLNKMWRSFKATDPVALAAQGKFKQAGKAAENHPLSTALEVIPAARAGEAVGTVERTTARLSGGRLATGALAERRAATVAGTNIVEPRAWSKDVFVRAAQKRSDLKGMRTAGDLRKQATIEDAAGRHRTAGELRVEANKADPHVVQPAVKLRGRGGVARQVDEHVSSWEEIRRAHRTAAVNAAHKIVKRSGQPRASLALAAQGIVSHDPADLAAYAREVRAHVAQDPEMQAHPHLDKRPKAVASERLLSEIDKELAGGKTDPAKLAQAAKDFRALTAPAEAVLAKHKLAPQAQLDKAAAIFYATRRMGAHYDATPRLTEHGVAEQATAADRHAATAAVQVAHTAASRADARVATLARKGETGAPMRAALARRDQVHAKLEQAVNAHAAALKSHAMVKRTAGRRSAVPGLVDAHGKPLTLQAIHAHMDAHGQPRPSFISQAPSAGGSKNFYVSPAQPHSISGAARTGEAVRAGTVNPDPHTLVEAAARQAGLSTAVQGFSDYIKRFAVRDAKNKGRPAQFASRKLAVEAAGKAAAHDGAHLRPVRMVPWQGDANQLEHLMASAEDTSGVPKSMTDSLREAFTATDGKGPWTLVPEEAAQRMEAHLKGSGAGLKTMQLGSSFFRKTVLTTSTKWLTGNIVEAMLRTAIHGAGPRDYLLARRVVSELKAADPAAHEQVAARALGGGHLSMAERVQIHRAADQFQDTRLEGIANKFAALRAKPGPKQLSQAWNAYTGFVLRTVNGTAESAFQTAMAGKAIRRQIVEPRVLGVSDRAVKDAAQGLRDTTAQNELGRIVDRAYGRYSKMSPGERMLVTLYTPFIAWTAAAFKFLTIVMPHDHPLLTAAAAAQGNMTREWRRAHGLAQGQGSVPDWLKGSYPVGGGYVQFSRYTPMGLASDPGGTLAGVLLPQIMGPVKALDGRDWKDDPLPKGTNRALAATKEFFGSTVPMLGRAMDVAGGKGSVPSRLEKQVNPLHVTGNKTASSSEAPLSPAQKALAKTQLSSGSAQDEVIKALQRTAGK